MIIIGETGGIACGKSFVSNLLTEKYGFECIDMDVISREVVKPGSSAYHQIIKAFPQCISQPLHSSSGFTPQETLQHLFPPIQRKVLADLVFSDDQARAQLNKIMKWPLLLALLKALCWSLIRCNRLVILSAPLLFEYKLEKLCKVVIVVFLEPESLQVERLVLRDHISVEQALLKIKAQVPLAVKKARADYLINNSNTFQETIQQVDELALKLEVLSRDRVDTKRVMIWLLVVLMSFLLFKWAIWVMDKYELHLY